MNKEDLKRLRKLQLIELEILLEVDRVCKKNKINYFLSEGTLLGAIRHHGFIPWEDDVDIMMFREDYEKFCKIAGKELKKDFILQNSNTLKKYWVIASKVRLTRETDFHQENLKEIGVTNDVGPYIDIFPLDYLPVKSSRKTYIIWKKIRAYRRLLWHKTRFSRKKSLKIKFLKIFSLFVSIEFCHNRIYYLMTKFNSDSRKYAVNYASYYSVDKQTIPIEKYAETMYVDFEGHKFPVPKQYDYILTNIYGDYMKLPPKEKRVNGHTFN